MSKHGEGVADESDLIAVIESNPGIRITEEREENVFQVEQFDPERPTEHRGNRVVTICLRRTDHSQPPHPFISHMIPGTMNFVYIDLIGDTPIASGTPYDEVLELLEISLAGLEIMDVLMRIPKEQRLQIAYRYQDIVNEARRTNNDGALERAVPLNCLPLALNSLRGILGK